MANEILSPGKKGNGADLTALWQDMWSGIIYHNFFRKTKFIPFITFKTLVGTNTYKDKYVGGVSFKKYTPGVAPEGENTTFNEKSVTVDTLVTARSMIDPLTDIQNDFDALKEVAIEQGEAAAKMVDSALAHAGIRAAQEAASTNPARPGGIKKTLAAGKENDAEALYTAIAGMIVDMQERDTDTDEMQLFMRPKHVQVLLQHPKLINSDYSLGAGDFAKGIVGHINGVPIVKTTAIAEVAEAGHPLSNAGNGNFYDVTAADAKAVALLLHRDAIIAVEAMPIQTKRWERDYDKMKYADADMAFAVGTRRQGLAGCVFKA